MKGEEIFGVKQIAQKAGVSIATVDRVLHNRKGVSENTKKKINAIIKKYNYQPNILARRLASRRLLKFATLIPAVSKETDYWQAPLNGIEQAEAEIKPFGITFDKYFFDLNDKQTFIAQGNKILKKNVDGILFAPSFVEDAKIFASECDKKNIPYVFINSDVPGLNNLCYVGPELFSSGYTGGHLVNYFVNDGEKALIINISKIPDSVYHLEEKEKGFREFFRKEGKKIEIETLRIGESDYPSIKKALAEALTNNDINVIFVTNSRVFYVAQYLEETKIKNIALVGYDFIEKNLNYLDSGVIDFLICQKPKAQAYRGVMALYDKLVKNDEVTKTHYMSIDIITKENYKFYKN